MTPRELAEEFAQLAKMAGPGRVRKILLAWAAQYEKIAKRRPNKRERPECGARTRAGGTCRACAAVRQDGTLCARCRMHGGLSTGPKTTEGKERIASAQRRRWELWRAAKSQRESP